MLSFNAETLVRMQIHVERVPSVKLKVTVLFANVLMVGLAILQLNVFSVGFFEPSIVFICSSPKSRLKYFLPVHQMNVREMETVLWTKPASHRSV